MSTPTAQAASPQPQSTLTPDQAARAEHFVRVQHYLALGTLISVPIILALPPRKLDFYTFTLAGCAVLAGNHLTKERYNADLIMVMGEKLGLAEKRYTAEAGPTSSMIRRAEERADKMMQKFDLPTERSREVHERIVGVEEALRLRREGRGYLMERARECMERGWGYGGDLKRMLEVAGRSEEEDAREGILPAVEEDRGRASLAGSMGQDDEYDSEDGKVRDGGVKGIAKKVWYGGEDENNWKAQRMREERQALEEGLSYSDMILEQIWEVWNWDKRKNEDGEWVTKDEYKGKFDK